MKVSKFRIYLLFCIFMFVVLTFIVLFYSFGYKYNPDEGKIIQTGAVILRTFPNDAQIYLDGRLIRKNVGLINLFGDAVKIEGLEPKTYEISVKSDDFSTWEKKIRIESDHVMEFKNIVLMKNKIKNKIISRNIETFGDRDFWISADKNRIAYLKSQNDRLSLFIFDLGSSEEKNLYELNKIFKTNNKDASIKKIIWSENDSKILILARMGSKDIGTVIDLIDNNAIYNLTEKNYNIDSNEGFQLTDFLFYIKDNALHRSSFLKTKVVTEKLLQDISDFLIKEGSIYYTRPGVDFLFKNNTDSFNSESVVSALPEDFDKQMSSRIMKSANNYLLFSGKHLFLLENANQAWKISANADNANFFDNSARILYNSGNEIWIYYIKEKKSQPQRQGHSNELITRYSGNISNIFLYKDNEHIFYREGYIFKFAELDERGARNVFDVVSVKNNDILYKASDNSILYLENGNLVRSSLDDMK